jgi:hypothetical protein
MNLTPEQREAFARDLRVLADLVADDPLVGEKIHGQLATNRLLIPVADDDDPVATMADFIRVGLDANLVISKSYDDNYGNVDLLFPGGLNLHVYAQRDQVCTRRVIGTREVTEDVPDPSVVVPTVTVTKTEDVVEWDCMPLLATRTREQEMTDAANDGFLDNAEPDVPGADDYLADVTS